jgi:hypothetical protein
MALDPAISRVNLRRAFRGHLNRHQLRLGLRDILEMLRQGRGDPGVQRLPRGAQQSAVRGVLYQ